MGRTRASAKKETSKRKKSEKGEEEAEKDEVKIEKKVKVNQDGLNQSFLKACKEGSVEEVKKLLEEGAEGFAVDEETGKNVLHFACKRKEAQEELVRFLIEKHRSLVQMVDFKQLHALHEATKCSSAKVCKILLDVKGCNVNATDGQGRTPLIVACELEYDDDESVEKARLFIERGADVKKKNELGDTALHSACSWGRPELVAILLEAGCDVNALGDDNRTPLMYACGNEMFGEEIIPILIEAGADVSLKNGWGQSVVNCAFGTGGKTLKALAPFVPEGCTELKWRLPAYDGADPIGAYCEGRQFGWKPDSELGYFVERIHEADATADWCWALLRNESFGLDIVFGKLQQLEDIKKFKMIVTELCSRNAGFNPKSGETLLHAIVLNEKLSKEDQLEAARFVMSFYINPFVPNSDGKRAVDYCDTKERELEALLLKYQRWRPDRRVMEWYGPYCKKRLVAFLLVEKRLRLGLNRDLKNLLLSHIAETEYVWVNWES
jgi:ankyrin repeat protein